MMLFLVVFKPFRSAKKNYMEIFNETCVFASELVLIAFAAVESEKIRNDKRIIYIGWVFLGFIILNIIVSMLKAFIESIIDLKKKCRKKCTKAGREEAERKKLNGPNKTMKTVREAVLQMLEKQAKNPFLNEDKKKLMQVSPAPSNDDEEPARFPFNNNMEE